MADSSQPMMPMAPPGTDPADYAAIMRRQRLAQMLTQAATTPIEAPQTQATKGVYVQPRVGILSPLSRIAEAVMARKAMDSSSQDQARMMQGTMQAFAPGGGSDASGPGVSPHQAAPPGGGPSYGGGPGASDVTPQAASLGQTAGQRVNPLNPAGLPPQVAARIYQEHPEEFAKIALGPEAWQMALRLNGNDPTAAAAYARQTPEYRTEVAKLGSPQAVTAAAQAKATKEGSQTARQGESVLIPHGTNPDGSVHYTEFRNPLLKDGQELERDPNGEPLRVRNIPGAVDANRSLVAGETQGRESQTPRVADTAHGPTFVYPTSAPPVGGAAPMSQGPPRTGAPPPGIASPGSAPNAVPGAPPAPRYFPPSTGTNSGAPAAPGLLGPQDKESLEKTGAKGAEAGVEYRHDLSEQSNGAIEVMRSLSEMRNLARQADPNSLNNAKTQMGRVMVALGAAPDSVANFVGANEAAVKQTAGLAVSTIHQLTSRGTNFDLDTFMKNNPNLLQSPQGFQKVMEYLENKTSPVIDKQQDFENFIKPDKDGNRMPTEDWMPAHTAAWNQKQLDRIKKGEFNSTDPTQPSREAIQAEVARRAAARAAASRAAQ